MKRCTFLLIMMLGLLTANAQPQTKRESKMKATDIVLDYSKPVHSLGFSFTGYCGFAARVVEGYNGPFTPHTFNRLSPEFSVQYSCIFNKHVGFMLEIPMGIFQRNMFVDLSAYNAESFSILLGGPYIGFTPKISYFKDLGRKVNMQVDAGLKFMPFSFPNNYWFDQYEHSFSSGYDCIYCLEVPSACYLIPDITASLQFLIHSRRNPRNNFVIGITGNFSFARRMVLSFDTYQSGVTCPEFEGASPLPMSAYSSGKVICNSSSIGLTIGYRFMGLRP